MINQARGQAFNEFPQTARTHRRKGFTPEFFDGFRCLAHPDGDTIELRSKNGQPLTRYFPEIAAALQRLAADGFTLDGELAVPLAGAASFDALQQRIHPRGVARRAPRAHDAGVLLGLRLAA
jgi:ATP-dependent DNA ligase